MNLRNDAPPSKAHSTAEASGEAAQLFSGRGADVLVECLIRAGVSTIFGLPGDTGVDLYDALFHRTADIQHVLTRDERHAATMADAYARAKGAVGVVEVSSGGGTTYVVGGLGEAFAAAVPVLLITSDIHRGSRGTGALTQIDQAALFSAVTKWQHVVEDVRDIPDLLRTALEQATSGRPAPVVLILPEDVLADEAELVLGSFAAQGGQPLIELPRERPSAPPHLVRRAAAALQAARRPAIVAGSGVHVSRAYDVLERLSEHLGIPVATSIHGKGVISDINPWRLGVVGANGGRELANDYLSGADLVLLVGTRGNATDTYPWGDRARAHATTITVDITGQPIGHNFPASIPLVGDARTVLEQLLASTDPAQADQKATLANELSAAHRTWGAPLPTPSERATCADRLNPQHIVQIAREVYGSSALVLADPGTPTPNTVMHWDLEDSGRSVLVPRGHGPMGWAVPAAIGAAFAQPKRRVVSFTADGSFAMCCGELETVNRFQLPITFIQLTNFSLGWIKMLQHLYEGERYFGVDPGPIDAVMVAQACGLSAIRVRSLDEFSAALEQTTHDSGPLYIDVDVTHLMVAPPAVAPWQAALSGHAERPVY